MTIAPTTAKEEAEVLNLNSEALYFSAQRQRELIGIERDQLYLEAEREGEQERQAGDMHHRVLTFTAEVDSTSVTTSIQLLSRWARLSMEPITIIFCSPGGNALHGYRLFDYILAVRAQGIHVTTQDIGYAASMGGILLQAGDTRQIGPNSWLHLHEVSTGAIGKVTEIEDEVGFARRLTEQAIRIYAERSKFSAKDISDRIYRHEWWMDASEAVEAGFADSVIVPANPGINQA